MKRTPRRKFLAKVLAGGVALETLGSAVVRAASTSVNEQLALAVIGLNGIGHVHVRNLTERSDVRIACLCDVDEKVLSRAAHTVKEASRKTPKLVPDFRQVLDDPAIDAVVIAAPHHWHCPIALRALQAGKDVYLVSLDPLLHLAQSRFRG
ncbi:Gfo/Idh/MocA family oxidoreductase [Acidobacteria bacterium AH-259-G07]|nr:Gfo/Idh/MocA family oxidoreductase [Acidobacteria bacterium AH-259-G07]